MAIMTTIHCERCKETKRESRSGSDHSRLCWDCSKAIEVEKRTNFLNERAALTIEERLSLIEQWIYDYRPPVNVRDVVFG